MKTTPFAFIVGLLLTSAALAALNDFDHQAFDATYEQKNANTGDITGRWRIVSDGNGHMRVETEGNRVVSGANGHERVEIDPGQPKSVEILDLRHGTHCYIDQANRAFKKIEANMIPPELKPFAGPPAISMPEQPTGTPLGQKVVAGHPCHGYEVTSSTALSSLPIASSTGRAWFGDDTHHLVRGEFRALNGTLASVTELKSWSTAKPDAVLFSIPSGYREIKLHNESPPEEFTRLAIDSFVWKPDGPELNIRHNVFRTSRTTFTFIDDATKQLLLKNGIHGTLVWCGSGGNMNDDHHRMILIASKQPLSSPRLYLPRDGKIIYVYDGDKWMTIPPKTGTLHSFIKLLGKNPVNDARASGFDRDGREVSFSWCGFNSKDFK
jgi:hypothetical protein